MTEMFHIAARAAFESGPYSAHVADGHGTQGLPFGLQAILITMICAALGAMVLKRRIPALPLNACLSVLIAFGTLLAAWQTGQHEIAIGGFCVIVGIYMLEYFSQVMASVEQDLSPDHDPDTRGHGQDGIPSSG